MEALDGEVQQLARGRVDTPWRTRRPSASQPEAGVQAVQRVGTLACLDLSASEQGHPLPWTGRDHDIHCEGCDADFRPARPWSRFCGPARRLSAPIAALFTLGKILDRILSSMRPLARVRSAIPDGKCAVEWKLFRFGPGSATSLSRSPKVELIAGALPQ